MFLLNSILQASRVCFSHTLQCRSAQCGTRWVPVHADSVHLRKFFESCLNPLLNGWCFPQPQSCGGIRHKWSLRWWVYCSTGVHNFSVRHSVLLYVFLHISLSLITVIRLHSTSQPCSSKQCNTARLESKLICHSKHVHLIPWDWTLVFKQGSTPRIPMTTLSYETTTPQYEECSRLQSGTLLYSHSPLIALTLSQLSIFTSFSATYHFYLLHIF